MNVYELNLDGLVGPTHHYAGLSRGNLASTSNALLTANPAAAAHQGIEKMRALHRMGFKQALLPPHQRPNLQLLHQLGFHGTPAQQIRKAKIADPRLLSASYSASSMWAANAATISPSIDTNNQRLHFTAANLMTNLHRHQETAFSQKLLQHIFSNPHYFEHHDPLPNTMSLGDEGAANHNRFCPNHKDAGIHLFVYGKQAFSAEKPAPPLQFPARQTLEASQAIARNHQLDPARVFYAAQNPAAINQGVFHNDVIAVANESVFLVHEEAFLQQRELLHQIQNAADFPLHIIEVPSRKLSVANAVQSYLFNAQLLTCPNSEPAKKMILIAPIECQTPPIHAFLNELIDQTDNPIESVQYFDLKQSMLNGGGPACLRLRIPLNEDELAAMHQGVLVTDRLLDTLDAWVRRHYRTRLHVDELDDPSLIDECLTALDELTNLLKLGRIYPFQMDNTASILPSEQHS